MSLFSQPQCLLRAGGSMVRGAWVEGGAACRFAEAPYAEDDEAAAIGKALQAALGLLLPRRLSVPRVSIGLAANYVQAAIVHFQAMPKAAKDRELLISQRFCRECRLDPSAVMVRGATLAKSAGGGETVLCCAVSRALASEIARAAGAHCVHADIVAPDYLLGFAEADNGGLSAPGMVLLQWAGAGAVLVWDKEQTLVHASMLAAEEDQAEAGRRAVARVKRYSAALGPEGAPFAVYASGRLSRDAAFAQAVNTGGAKLLGWPGVTGLWDWLGGGAE
jgi:hypothetical protein